MPARPRLAATRARLAATRARLAATRARLAAAARPAVAPVAALAVAGALVAAALAPARTPQRRPGGVRAAYRGKTSQGIVVTLSALSGAERIFRYRAKMKCTDGTTWLDAYFGDRVQVRAGSFSSRHSADRGAIVTTVTGTLAGKRANGTIKIVEHFSAVLTRGGVTPLSAKGKIRCRSPIVRWHARAA